MKKLAVASYGILVFLYAFVPIGQLIGFSCGYDFEIFNNSVFTVFLAVVSVLLTVLLFVSKLPVSKLNGFLALLIMPLSLITGFCLLFSSTWRLTGVFVLVTCLSAFILLAKFAQPLVAQIIVTTFSCLVFNLLVFVACLSIFIGSFGCNTVVQTVASPQNRYVAKVIDSDQGALGGNTWVDIYENKSLNLLFCRFTKTPVRVYRGKWGEFQDMKISWNDEETIMINGKPYSVYEEAEL
ncbi:MAG: hypothetical protein J6M02_01635 [Clostridia bacterium]|nr:hypothetical protein [Clostridia bacterium]